MASPWTHIIIEAYCLYDCHSQRITSSRKYLGMKNGKPRWGRLEEHKNSDYINPQERPRWCKQRKVPNARCLASKCPFFAWSNAEMKVYRILYKNYPCDEK